MITKDKRASPPGSSFQFIGWVPTIIHGTILGINIIIFSFNGSSSHDLFTLILKPDRKESRKHFIIFFRSAINHKPYLYIHVSDGINWRWDQDFTYCPALINRRVVCCCYCCHCQLTLKSTWRQSHIGKKKNERFDGRKIQKQKIKGCCKTINSKMSSHKRRGGKKQTRIAEWKWTLREAYANQWCGDFQV